MKKPKWKLEHGYVSIPYGGFPEIADLLLHYNKPNRYFDKNGVLREVVDA